MAAFSMRGVLEGFYGRPWSPVERLDIVAFAAEHGFNAYAYAPKDDPHHRELWREPYPEAKLAELGALIARCRESGMAFLYAISPGLSLRHADPAELDALWEKLEVFIGLGVESFGLFLDDIPPSLVHAEDRARYGGLVEAQGDFLNRLHDRLRAHDPALRLTVCPTAYCGDPDQPYLRALGEALPPEIEILWTGPSVCSHRLTVEHLGAVARALRRPPLVWDNYPVNDGGMEGELHIGPYEGREPGLPEVCRGILANGMTQPEAGKLPLATIGAYLRDPEGYDPDAAWRAAAGELVGEELIEPLAVFAESNTVSCLRPEEPAALVAWFEAIAEDAGAFRFREGIAKLRLGAARMRDAQIELAASDTPAVRDMAPWLREYDEWTELLEVAAGMYEAMLTPLLSSVPLEHREAERTVLEGRERLRAALKEKVDARTYVCGDAVRHVLQGMLRRTAGAQRDAPPIATEAGQASG